MSLYQQLAWQSFQFQAVTVDNGDTPVNGIADTITTTDNDSGEQLANQPTQEAGDTTGTYDNELTALEVTGTATLNVMITSTTPSVTFRPNNPLPLTLIDPATLSTDHQYCTVSDLYSRFGSENVNKWADLNNTRNVDDIAQTIINQIAISSNYIDTRLRNKKYKVPFDSPYELQITEICVLHAGTHLHSARGIEDLDGTFAELRNRAEWMIRDILAGRLVLETETLTNNPGG